MKKKGFTLIELLVVIAIIGLLATMAVVSFASAQQKARDSKRLADMAQIQKAINLYLDEYGTLPAASVTGDTCCGAWDTAPCDADPNFIQALVTAGFFGTVPVDPSGDGTSTTCNYKYRYYRYGAGSYGCDAARGLIYILGVTDMETVTGPHPDSPGFSCPTRDWYASGFEYLTGGFQN